ncbi:hypothetical protein E5288_WYG022288 [Bos mutus]|uniref:Uncharacterized protein n=1 Tax=Bos mutus TaxID=72004 RepID=A0A6B0RUA5_9CETA|nr:hypothetical protein [Bos mutus]
MDTEQGLRDRAPHTAAASASRGTVGAESGLGGVTAAGTAPPYVGEPRSADRCAQVPRLPVLNLRAARPGGRPSSHTLRAPPPPRATTVELRRS